MNNNTCSECGKQLNARQKKYCSMNCLTESKRTLVNIDCEHCGKNFFPKNRYKKYCSPSCGSSSRKTFTNEEYLEMIKDISVDGYANTSDLPGRLDVIIRKRFGSWMDACLAAGVKPFGSKNKHCGVCNEELELDRGRRTKYCGEECSHEANHNRWIDNTHRRKRAMEDTETEKIDRLLVFERSSWSCHICGDKVNRENKHPHLGSPSMDHVVPLSKGGSHTYDNVKLAHLGCNISKGAESG